MIRRRHATLLVLGLLAPLALVDAPAGAIDQDLVASAAAGPPGTEVTLSSASCTAGGNDEAVLDVQLYSGTEPDLKLAGLGSGPDGSVTLTIPDWMDPDQPATFLASCYLYDDDSGDSDSFDYDPVTFDVEPGAAAPVQVPTFSRTSLLSGQGTLVSGAGCDGADQVMVVALAGTDLSGRTSPEDDGAYAFGGPSGGSFDVELAMTNSYVGINLSGSSDSDAVELETEESPNTMAPGSYSVFPYCISDNTALVLEPTVIELTGTADTTNTDLQHLPLSHGKPEFDISGTCTAGDVAGSLGGESLESMTGEAFDARTRGLALRNAPGAPQSDGNGLRLHAADRAALAGTRVVSDGVGTEFEVTPDQPTGAWYWEDAADYDEGYVTSFATCGDTLEDGYYYDAQVLELTPPPVDPTVPPLVPPVVPAPAPADAVPGTPTYAG